MAQAVVGFVLKKLDDVIEKKIELLGGVENQVKWAQSELIAIQSCLKDAHSKRKGDERVKYWLKQLCDVAYRIEDVIDTFFLEVEDDHTKNPKFFQKLMQPFNKGRKMPILHKLGTELSDIQNDLKEISRRRVEYGIQLPQNMEVEQITLSLRRAAYLEVDETEIIGLQDDQKNIIELLSAKVTPRRAVITIVGTGGLGKTTLARMVYNSANADFGYFIMLSISKQFSLTDLLRKMLQHQPKDSVYEDDDVGDLISNLKKKLSSQRYLIILDDVWEVDLWNQLKVALPDVNNGSRVLITSRSIDIAMSADPFMKPYRLKFLDDNESLDLFLKKTFPNKELSEECAPTNLIVLANKLAKKCKGLPLALIVLGSILSKKERAYHVWEEVLRTLDWHSDGRGCMDVLALSYEDMPYYLKACFLYLASFPENYEISAKRLIRMLVAEGFLPQEETKTMEKIAENCLEELVQRSMVQVLSRCVNGSIKCFQVHDLLHDLAVHEARQENFVTVFKQASNVSNPNRDIRRSSLQFPLQSLQRIPQVLEYAGPDTHFSDNPEFVGPNTRSLLLFGFGLSFVLFGFVLHLPKCSNFRLLKVLELVGVTNYANKLVEGIDQLIHLKYLGFRNCKIPISSCSFRHMKTLETLDMRGTEGELNTSNVLWTVGTLRHVLVDGTLDGPISSADLRNLKTMRWVKPLPTWATKLPHLNNLCELGVREVDNWDTLYNLLKTLPSLVSLGIMGTGLPMEIVYPMSLPCYENLQSLYLEGTWSVHVTLEASSFPPHLLKLTIIKSLFHQNPMPELGKLMSLKKLHLGTDVFSYSGPTICPAGFPNLQHLKVLDQSIKDLIVADGVMPKLRYLQVHDKIEFHLPPELQHMTVNVKKL